MRFLLSSLLLLFVSCSSSAQEKYDYKVALDPTWQTLELPSRSLSVKVFSLDLIEEICKVQKVKIRVVDTNWDYLIPGLKNKTFQGILSNIQSYLFYEKIYDFSDLYLATGPTVVVPKGVTLSSLASLEGKEVGVIEGDKSAFLMEKFPGILQRSYLTLPEAFNALLAGSIDAVFTDILTAEAYCNDLFHNQLAIAFPPLTQEGLRLITLHENAPELLHHFNEGLRKLKESGQYDLLLQKWGLRTYPSKKFQSIFGFFWSIFSSPRGGNMAFVDITPSRGAENRSKIIPKNRRKILLG